MAFRQGDIACHDRFGEPCRYEAPTEVLIPAALGEALAKDPGDAGSTPATSTAIVIGPCIWLSRPVFCAHLDPWPPGNKLSFLSSPFHSAVGNRGRCRVVAFGVGRAPVTRRIQLDRRACFRPSPVVWLGTSPLRRYPCSAHPELAVLASYAGWRDGATAGVLPPGREHRSVIELAGTRSLVDETEMEEKDLVRRFPDGFLFGTATASYQIEGAVDEDGRGRSIWDTFSHMPGKIMNGDTGDVACDHYHRFREDVGLMRELNLNAYRFSIAWPRVIPDGVGAVNQKGLDFYDALVDELLKNEIRPFVTLFHWDLPQALQDRGGFANREIVEAFRDYAAVVREALGDRVKDWITLNEPSVYSFMGHVLGVHAPGLNDPIAAAAVAHHLLLAHGAAVDVLREDPEASVGTTLNLTAVQPATDSAEDEEGARYADALYNRVFLDPVFGRGYPVEMRDVFPAVPEEPGDQEAIARPLDFLGINYYTRLLARGAPNSPLKFIPVSGPGPVTEMGWEVYPEGLEQVLRRVWNDYRPGKIFVTENGAAFADPVPQDGRVHDPERVSYLKSHLEAVLDAIDAGVEVGGYFCWSLLDNFEWSFGYSKRFGLIYVDYPTQRRFIKDSGKFYSAVAASGALG